ncbi:MAG: hypothetical protein LBK70_02655 [Clostridiales bacterium]|jgi:hypothetical protein|nr:hypothetical protein [Clostridiales bacterium]
MDNNLIDIVYTIGININLTVLAIFVEMISVKTKLFKRFGSNEDLHSLKIDLIKIVIVVIIQFAIFTTLAIAYQLVQNQTITKNKLGTYYWWIAYPLVLWFYVLWVVRIVKKYTSARKRLIQD